MAPHPHTGLQTVSWLFEGEIEHRDSAGHHAMVLPGEVNLMTAGRGISHSEVSTGATTTLHGAQLWVALPEASRDADPGFEHYAPPEMSGDGWRGRVFLGTLLGHTSPVATYSPLLGAELVLDPGAVVPLEVDPSFEHGVLVDLGSVHVDGETAESADLAYLPPGDGTLVLTAGEAGARVLVLGGTPFGEAIVMWWNFVGRTHEEVVGFRAEWQAQITRDGDGRPRLHRGRRRPVRCCRRRPPPPGPRPRPPQLPAQGTPIARRIGGIGPPNKEYWRAESAVLARRGGTIDVRWPPKPPTQATKRADSTRQKSLFGGAA